LDIVVNFENLKLEEWRDRLLRPGFCVLLVMVLHIN